MTDQTRRDEFERVLNWLKGRGFVLVIPMDPANAPPLDDDTIRFLADAYEVNE